MGDLRFFLISNNARVVAESSHSEQKPNAAIAHAAKERINVALENLNLAQQSNEGQRLTIQTRC